MEKKILAQGSYAFEFDELGDCLTIVFVLIKKQDVFVIDTFCGSNYMAEIMNGLMAEIAEKNIWVINTHHHWDHIWGNAYFEGKPIIAHEKCKPLMIASWEKDLVEEGKYFQGEQKLVLPTILLKEDEIWETEEIKIFTSPGHTVDGLSILDKETNFLYVGDNLERPLVYVEDRHLTYYIETLKHYEAMAADQIHAGHSLALKPAELKATICYLKKLSKGLAVNFKDPLAQKTHGKNLAFLEEKC